MQRVSHENEFVPRLSSHGRYGDEHIKPKRAEPISKSNCNASVMGRFSSSPSERYLVARIMLLSVVGTKGRHTMPSDPRPAGQSRTRDLPEHSQHYARPRQALVPATGPPKKRPYSTAPNFSYPLCGRNSIAPAELGRLHPHAMEDDAQLTRKSDFRALHAASLCNAERPAFQARKANRSR